MKDGLETGKTFLALQLTILAPNSTILAPKGLYLHTLAWAHTTPR